MIGRPPRAPDAAGAPAVRLQVAAGRLVPGESLAVVRIVVGAVAVLSAARLLARGWVAQLWSEPALLLGWPQVGVPVLPNAGLVAVVVVVGLAGVAVAVGLAPRTAAGIFLLAFGYLELLDRTTYLNHYWALTLLAALLVVLPTDGTWSLAARRRAGVPAWAVWLVRTQVAIVYVGAAIAKLDPDWLLRGQPLGMWLAARSDLAVVGPLIGLPAVGLVASWAGLAFDLTIVGWVWWRRTRILALVAALAFHGVTWALFPRIGVFPLLMVGLITVWMPPDWPSALRRRLRRNVGGAPVPAGPVRAGLVSPVHVRRRVPILAVLWIVAGLALPLRHLAIGGDVRWTEEGGRFAWRVMAEEKVGWATLAVTDPATGVTDRVALTDVLTDNQAHVAATSPDLLYQVAGELADRRAATAGTRPEVRVDARVSWNGRPNAPLVDPDVDLAAEPWRRGRHQPWILEPPP